MTPETSTMGVPASDAIGDFAERHIFTTLNSRYESASFSRDLWLRMGEIGLLGYTVPEDYGGSGGTARGLAEAARALARHGRDLGLALCWIANLALVLKSVESSGTEEQKRRYIPLLASGRWVGAMAFSEPEAGAHPGKLKTLAVPEGTGYRLNGRKTYTTGGPVADLFVVLAVTGGHDTDRKELTAFLLESRREGVRTESMELNFLRTAPHGEVVFEDVLVEDDCILGGRGGGHDRVSRAAFARERSLAGAALCGFFQAAANEVAGRYRQKYEELDLSGVEAGSWIHHLSALEAYRLISEELVSSSFEDMEKWRRSVDLLIYLGLSYGKWAFWIGEFCVTKQLEPTFPLDLMLNDIKLVLADDGMLLREGRKRYLR